MAADLKGRVALVTGVGRRSVSVRVDMWAESSTTGQRHRCTSVNLTYVAVDA